ncbi:MAG TPA: hypothetical protein VNI57_11090 [Candidatus Saccharimonadales bacterium]|nr:hypothetical protein [Candidatus Saccharimonadales bacterium]
MSTNDELSISVSPSTPAPGDVVTLELTGNTLDCDYAWKFDGDSSLLTPDTEGGAVLDTTTLTTGTYTVEVDRLEKGTTALIDKTTVSFELRSAASSTNSLSDSIARIAEEGVKVSVSSTKTTPTNDQALWVKIRQCVSGRQFSAYSDFIDRNLCQEKSVSPGRNRDTARQSLDDCQYVHGVHGYEILKAATEVFLLCESCCSDPSITSVDPDDEDTRLGYTPTLEGLQEALTDYLSPGTLRLPYLTSILENLNLTDMGTRFPFCEDSLRLSPCLYELIWSYWHEEAHLVQTMNAIAMRFQNRRVPGNGRDPLANMEINPLRPLSNLLWGYIQDGADGRRLTVARRAYEYAHEYGLQLIGKAVGDLRPADNRSRFIEAFHNLLYLCADYYRENTNQWITPDPYPLLDALRSVHVLLAEGAHNSFGDMPTTARAEMMIEQWLLAQPPMQQFLQSRAMVPYDEPWMGQVDAMCRLMGWPDAGVMYFHRLAVYGEQILLSIRWGNWSALNTTSEQAANWAIYWKPEIQGYIEAYRAVTGVELAPSFRAAAPVDTTQPSVLLSRRKGSDQATTVKA